MLRTPYYVAIHRNGAIIVPPQLTVNDVTKYLYRNFVMQKSASVIFDLRRDEYIVAMEYYCSDFTICSVFLENICAVEPVFWKSKTSAHVDAVTTTDLFKD